MEYWYLAFEPKHVAQAVLQKLIGLWWEELHASYSFLQSGAFS